MTNEEPVSKATPDATVSGIGHQKAVWAVLKISH